MRHSIITFFLLFSLNTSQLCAEEWLSIKDNFLAFPEGLAELGAAIRELSRDPQSTNVISYLEKSHNNGNPIASLLLSEYEQNPRRRQKLLENAVEHRIKEAVPVLGNHLYQHGKGKTSDFAKALDLFELASDWGTEVAPFYAGRMYHFGHGTEINYAKARSYYAIAITKDSPRASNNLSNLYIQAKGGPKDVEKSIALLKQASDAGMAMASQNLGLRYRKDVENAPDWKYAEYYYLRAVDQSEGKSYEAAYQIGRIAQFGYGDQEPDFKRAITYYQTAVDGEHDLASYNLARIYQEGKYIKRDLQKAWDLYEISAKSENPKAIFALGRMTETGQFGVPDLRATIPYYRKAHQLGYAQASANLAHLLWETDRKASIEEIHSLNKEAIAKGNLTATANYGYLNLFEVIEDADPAYGLELLHKAAAQNSHQAIKNLHFYYSGWGELREPDQELADYWAEKMRQTQ